MEFRLGQRLTHLLVLAPGRVQQMRHADCAAVVRGEKRRPQRDVLDVAPAQFKLIR